MLHRTKAEQVIPIYNHFLKNYDTIRKFTIEERIQIKNLLFGLGLHWRIDGMINALHQLWNEYGEVPKDYELLMKIRGIGQYIAGATVCFSTNKPFILIDTNIVRVIGRNFNLRLSGEARRRKDVYNAISTVVDENLPRDFYYAIIDIAHTICHPKIPECSKCPLSDYCLYFKSSQTNLD
jgi:A/G-specific adenine glycosylase